EPDAHHPPVLVRRAVHERGVVLERAVHRHDLAGDRSEEIAHRLHRVDRAERLHVRHLGTRGRELDEDHVPQLPLRVVGHADHGLTPLDADPLVLLRVAQLARHVHQGLLGFGDRTDPCWYIGRAVTLAGTAWPRVTTSTVWPGA